DRYGPPVPLDQERVRGAAGARFEPDRTGAGVQVEEASALQRTAQRLQCGEQGLADTVGGGSGGRAGGGTDPLPTGGAGDDPGHDRSRNRPRSDSTTSTTATASVGWS